MSTALQPLTNRGLGTPNPAISGAADTCGTVPVRTILIVDDSHFERSVIRSAVHTLTKFHVCGEASDGAEAINKAKELRPDLVIMDLAMPQMNGVEVAMVLKNTMPKVPVVLFTLYAEQLRGAIPQSSGVTIIVSKTDGLAPLLECIHRLLAA
jgi:two-component system chemotaxis response regulator CheY